MPGTDWGFWKVFISDPDRLRLFFLSLLWRAAVTSRFEFNEVEIPAFDVETLRLVLTGKKSVPLSFYPATLVQLYNRGITHNFAPIADVKVIPALEDEPEREIPIFRFYFDGLIVHMHCHSSDFGYTDGIRSLVVGGDSLLTVTAVSSENSLQHKNLIAVMANTIG